MTFSDVQLVIFGWKFGSFLNCILWVPLDFFELPTTCLLWRNLYKPQWYICVCEAYNIDFKNILKEEKKKWPHHHSPHNWKTWFIVYRSSKVLFGSWKKKRISIDVDLQQVPDHELLMAPRSNHGHGSFSLQFWDVKLLTNNKKLQCSCALHSMVFFGILL